MPPVLAILLGLSEHVLLALKVDRTRRGPELPAEQQQGWVQARELPEEEGTIECEAW